MVIADLIESIKLNCGTTILVYEHTHKLTQKHTETNSNDVWLCALNAIAIVSTMRVIIYVPFRFLYAFIVVGPILGRAEPISLRPQQNA